MFIYRGTLLTYLQKSLAVAVHAVVEVFSMCSSSGSVVTVSASTTSTICVRCEMDYKGYKVLCSSRAVGKRTGSTVNAYP